MMKRRQFLATACATGFTAASMQTAPAVEPSDQPNFLDFRIITASNALRLEAMVEHDAEVMIPFANKHGIAPCGLFVTDPVLNAKETAYDKKYDNALFCLTPHRNLASVVELMDQIRNDSNYRESQAKLLQGTTSKDPLYTAHDRMLLRCFPEFPEIKVPSPQPNRIFQLRMYRSHNFDRSWAKAHQIATEEGALWLFEECGIKTVFMSATLFGPYIPSLVFMLCFESEEHKNDGWAKFVNHPGWKKLAANPAYADTVTEIINIFLTPCQGSQI